MADLNLTGQETEKIDIAPKILKLKTLLDTRRPFWEKMSIEQKKAWIASNNDPIITTAYQVWRFLNAFFGKREAEYVDN